MSANNTNEVIQVHKAMKSTISSISKSNELLLALALTLDDSELSPTPDEDYDTLRSLASEIEEIQEKVITVFKNNSLYVE